MADKISTHREVSQMVSYFYFRGMIMQHLERFEDCYSSYIRALCVPCANSESEYFQIMVVAYNKALLFRKMVQLYQGVPDSEQDLRSSLNMMSNLHFVNQ